MEKELMNEMDTQIESPMESYLVEEKALAWWDAIRSKRVYRSRNRGLSIEQIYRKEVLKETITQ